MTDENTLTRCQLAEYRHDASTQPANTTRRAVLEVETILDDALDGRRVVVGWWPSGHAYALSFEHASIVVSIASARRLAFALLEHLDDEEWAA